jgi:CRISPR-associated endonuclease/helicase Cas3
VVSDVAPLAQLLQRAGRCMRHQRKDRPGWVGDEPRLVVLEPVQEGKVVPPRTWGTVYDTSLLRRTSRLLREVEPTGIGVPGDVQRLIDAVYADDFGDRLESAAEREELQRLDAEREAAGLAEEQLAQMTVVPSPTGLTDLARLSDDGLGLVDEAMVTTRLGADSERAVCAYVQSGGELTLDPKGRTPLPGHRGEGGRLAMADVRSVMRQSVPLPGRWLAQRSPEQESPAAWANQPLLSDLTVLRMRPVLEAVSGEGLACSVWACQVGDRTLTMSDVGLRLSLGNPFHP